MNQISESNKIKILITAPSLETSKNVSGISSVVAQIVEHSRNEFYHFTAGRRDGEKVGFGWILRQIAIVPHFFRQIRREKIEIVHINTALAPLSILRDSILTRTAKFADSKVLLQLHGGRFFTLGFTNTFLKRLTEKMLRRADAILVLSEIEKTFIEKHWQNLEVRVLENAVSVEKFEKPKSNSDEKTIIFLGRLHEDKGLCEIIESCRILKNEGFQFRFKCFGAGEAKDFFVAEMSEIFGEKFTFGGVISGAEKQKELAESDVFLLPSRYEGLPVAMLEAMSNYCVPVVSNVGSIGSVIENGVNGFLIEPQNVSQIVEKLRMILSHEIDLENLGKNARKTVEEKFNLKDYINKLEKIYREIS